MLAGYTTPVVSPTGTTPATHAQLTGDGQRLVQQGHGSGTEKLSHPQQTRVER